MINDTANEELFRKVSAAKISKREVNEKIMPKNQPQSVENTVPNSNTSGLNPKPTSPTLIEFHSKNSTLPEWRLQLQNVVRQRQGSGKTDTTTVTSEPISTKSQTKLVTSGANALKVEPNVEIQPVLHTNPDVARALQRIKDSRQKFLADENPQSEQPTTSAKTNRNYPFYIAAKTNEAEIKSAETNSPVNSFAKPKLAASLRTDNPKLDTNKLPPLPLAVEATETILLRSTVSEEIQITETTITEAKQSEVKIIKSEDAIKSAEVEEFDETATLAMRFNAGLFDLIIGSFTSLILIAPFMLMSGNWLSWSGLFAFVATSTVVMFIYLTTTIGLYGRTFGMRLFSLELIDIEGEHYPTFHQAAVSSSVYLLSLSFVGLGFLTIPFNEEKRAVHDLVSGTLVVREEA